MILVAAVVGYIAGILSAVVFIALYYAMANRCPNCHSVQTMKVFKNGSYKLYRVCNSCGWEEK